MHTNNINLMTSTEEKIWQEYHSIEETLMCSDERNINTALSKFKNKDFLVVPIVLDLVSSTKISILKKLYNQGTPLTYEDADGTNALHVACGASGSLECVKFFLDNHILTDINKKSMKYGETPLTLAVSYGHKDILAYFKEKLKVTSVSMNELEVIADRVQSNYIRK